MAHDHAHGGSDPFARMVCQMLPRTFEEGRVEPRVELRHQRLDHRPVIGLGGHGGPRKRRKENEQVDCVEKPRDHRSGPPDSGSIPGKTMRPVKPRAFPVSLKPV